MSRLMMSFIEQKKLIVYDKPTKDGHTLLLNLTSMAKQRMIDDDKVDTSLSEIDDATENVKAW